MEANQKRKGNSNDDDYESYNVQGKKERNSDDDEPRIFNCDIFHHKDPKKAKFEKSKVKLDYDEKEKTCPKFQYQLDVEYLFHYSKLHI